MSKLIILIMERFFEKIKVINKTKCWEWQTAKDKDLNVKKWGLSSHEL